MTRKIQAMRKIVEFIDKPFVIVSVALGLTAILVNLDFNFIEAKLYDLRVVYSLHTKPDPNIVLITLDTKTTDALDDIPPLTLDKHAQFLEALELLNPKGVGYLIDLSQVIQANQELLPTQWGTRFASSAARMQNNGTALLLGTPYDVTGETIPPAPLNLIPHSIAVLHKDGNVFSTDKVTRRALLELNGTLTFHSEFARLLGLLNPAQLPPGSFQVPEVDGKYFFFDYHGNTKVGKPAPYKTISFLDVLQGKLPPNALNGKIVLVGTLFQDDWNDFIATPFAKDSFSNPKIAVHATILDSIIHRNGVTRAPKWLNWITTAAVTTFVIAWVLSSTPLGGVLCTLLLALGLLLFGQALFQFKHFWLQESQPLLAIFLGYYLSVPYRLIREYEKRWDYQRKNEILTQVEELKTNFISLITHDLKTPVARIQGLAEVLLRKSSARLLAQDIETLRHMIGATEELNHFISSILELNKVESSQLQLKWESKDVNQLIERSIEGFKAQARAKQISLVSELEPLFPIKIDVSLISKVINNLIDNAIKYSPPHSEIRVTSREVGSDVEIAVKDQGIGLDNDEQRSLFTRFYRAKNDTTVKTTGTGLGLYLTKYFIEAHRGRVEVESTKGMGSTFRIYLSVAGQPPALTQQSKLTHKSGKSGIIKSEILKRASKDLKNLKDVKDLKELDLADDSEKERDIYA